MAAAPAPVPPAVVHPPPAGALSIFDLVPGRFYKMYGVTRNPHIAPVYSYWEVVRFREIDLDDSPYYHNRYFIVVNRSNHLTNDPGHFVILATTDHPPFLFYDLKTDMGENPFRGVFPPEAIEQLKKEAWERRKHAVITRALLHSNSRRNKSRSRKTRRRK